MKTVTNKVRIDKLKLQLAAVRELNDILRAAQASAANALSESQGELDAVHDLLDSMPGALPRVTTTPGQPDRQNTALQRLVSWLRNS